VNEAWSKLPLEAKQRVMRLHGRSTRCRPERIHQQPDWTVSQHAARKNGSASENANPVGTDVPEERQKAREQFQQRRQAFEQKWRQEHPGEEPPPFHRVDPKPPPHRTIPTRPKTYQRRPMKSVRTIMIVAHPHFWHVCDRQNSDKPGCPQGRCPRGGRGGWRPRQYAGPSVAPPVVDDLKLTAEQKTKYADLEAAFKKGSRQVERV
jgi:hypothetical protein